MYLSLVHQNKQIMTATEKLIEQVTLNGNIEIGTESISKDENPIKYRYDRITLKYEHAANFLVSLFEKAAVENGNKRYSTQFNAGVYGFAYARPSFKGQPNGKIYISVFKNLGNA